MRQGAEELVLASASPRRRELLALLGFPFQVIVPEGEESLGISPGEEPEVIAERLAWGKARAVGERERTVVAADTLVVYRGDILGKPQDIREAESMLRRLRGERHQVVTGVAALNPVAGRGACCHAVTTVEMRSYSDAEIAGYIASGDPWDKAGAYAIQNPAFAPVAAWDGCYFNVVGLPLCALLRALREVGYEPARRPLEHIPSPCQDCPERHTLRGGGMG
jgi:MAF protein